MNTFDAVFFPLIILRPLSPQLTSPLKAISHLQTHPISRFHRSQTITLRSDTCTDLCSLARLRYRLWINKSLLTEKRVDIPYITRVLIAVTPQHPASPLSRAATQRPVSPPLNDHVVANIPFSDF